MIGRTIGSYRVTKLLGEGGMGAVYQATDNIEREVAIKALRPQVMQDPARLERFQAEAVALGRLHHPNITSLFHLLEESDGLYMVMEFVNGQTFDELIRFNGALPPRLAVDVLIDGLHGFEHAHSRGVIHRDIKASNLMISAEGSTKIMDFGIARMDGAERLTQTGQIIGTLAYMSPEQVRGGELDARSDIYSLGILLFELVTGRVPFNDANDFDLMRAHLEKDPPSVKVLGPTLPAAFDEIIAKALAKNPDERFQNIVELRAALKALIAEVPETAKVPTPGPITKARPTLIEWSEPGDKYGTRLEGIPLPVLDSPPPPSPSPTAVPPAPPQPVTHRSKAPLIAACGAVVLIFGALLWALFHSRTSAPPRAPHSASRPIRRTEPVTVVKPHVRPKHHARTIAKFKSHHVDRAPAIKHSHHVTHHSASPKRSESATLRAIVKGG